MEEGSVNYETINFHNLYWKWLIMKWWAWFCWKEQPHF